MFVEEKNKTVYWIKPQSINANNGIKHNWFRNVFEYSGEMCSIKIAVHNRYKLFINKKRVAAGPCAGDRWRCFWDEIDISDYLKMGSNEILIQVVSYPPESYDMNTDGGPMHIVSHYEWPSLLVSSNYNSLITGSGNWKTAADKSIEWLNQKLPSFTCVGPVEKCSISQSPINDDSVYQWSNVIKIGKADEFGYGEHSPFMLKKRPIPYLKEKKHELMKQMPAREDDADVLQFINGKATAEAGKKYYCEFDAGELINSYISIKAKGRGKITVTYAECYTDVGKHYYIKDIRDDWESKTINGFSDVVNVDGMCEYEPFDWRCFRFIRIEVEAETKQLDIYLPSIKTVDYPMEVLSSFNSAEKWTQDLWDISIRTLKRCMHDRYMDCPYYERMQYSLDTYLETLYTYRLSNDSLLARKAIEDFRYTMTPEGMLTSRAPTNRYNVIPSFSLFWVMMLKDYYMETGDKEYVKENIAALEGIINWYTTRIDRESGLVNSYGYWNFIDWCGEWADERGVLTGEPKEVAQTGISATNTLIFSYALGCAAQLFAVAGNSEKAHVLKEQQNKMNASVVDGCTTKSGLISELPGNENVVTQHAQVWAVLSGALDYESGRKVLLKSAEGSYPQCTFVMRFFLLRAYEKTGLYCSKLKETLLPWVDALKLNLTTWPEDFARQRSDCHAWSSLPIFEFTSGVLGINPMSAGWSSIIIKPNFIDLESAQGSVITPKGYVEVMWKKEKDKVFVICTIPKGTKAVLELPDGSATEFTEKIESITQI